MRRLYLTLELLFIISVGFAQENYSVKLPPDTYLITNEMVQVLVGNELKKLDSISLRNITSDDWNKESFKSLFLFVRQSSAMNAVWKNSKFYVANSNLPNKLESISYFPVDAALNLGTSPEAYLTDYLRTNEASEFTAFANKPSWLKLQIMVVNEQLKTCSTPKCEVKLLPSDYTYHGGFDHPTIDFDRKDESYFEEIAKKRLICPIIAPKRKSISFDRSSLTENLDKAPGVHNFKVKKNRSSFMGYDQFLTELMNKGFEGDTITIEQYGQLFIASSSKIVYIIDPYSNELIEIGSGIKKVITHKYFSSFLKSITKQDLPGIRSNLAEVDIIDDETFYLKFQNDDFHRIVTKQLSFRVRNFNLISNKKETIALLAGKVDPKKIVEVKALDEKLFILSGSELLVYTPNGFTSIANNVADLENSLLRTDKSIYVVTTNPTSTINLIRLDKQSYTHKVIATNLRHLTNGSLIQAFLQYNDTLKEWPVVLGWNSTSDNQSLIVNYDNSTLILQRTNNTTLTKKVKRDQLIKNTNAEWFKTFMSAQGEENIWEWVFSNDSTLYLHTDSKLFYIKNNQITRYDSIPLKSLIYNRDFISELDPNQKLDTLFSERTESRLDLAAVKYQKESFYRVYILDYDKPQHPMRISNYKSFSKDNRILTAVVDILQKHPIKDTISFSEIDQHKFFSSSSRLLYFDPVGNDVVAVAEKKESLGGNVDFLKTCVIEKINEFRQEKHNKNLNIRIEKSIWITDENKAESGILRENYYLYKFENEDRYHVRFEPDPSTIGDEIQPFNTVIYVKHHESVFGNDAGFQKWFLKHYVGNSIDTKVMVASKNNPSGYVVLDNNGFMFYYSPEKQSFFSYNSCNQTQLFSGSVLSLSEIDATFNELVTGLFQSLDTMGNYKILGMSKHGTLFCKQTEIINCLDEDPQSDSPSFTFYIYSKKNIRSAKVGSDQLPEFVTAINKFLNSGTLNID